MECDKFLTGRRLSTSKLEFIFVDCEACQSSDDSQSFLPTSLREETNCKITMRQPITRELRRRASVKDVKDKLKNTAPLEIQNIKCSSKADVVHRSIANDNTTKTRRVNTLGKLRCYIIGRRGQNITKIKEDTGCKILVRGRGCLKDKQQEESLRGKLHWEHLEDALHVLILREDSSIQSEAKINIAADRIRNLIERAVQLQAETEAKSKTTQLAEKNTAYRDARSQNSAQCSSTSTQRSFKSTQSGRFSESFSHPSELGQRRETIFKTRKRRAQEPLAVPSDDEKPALTTPQRTHSSDNANSKPSNTSSKRKKPNTPGTTFELPDYGRLKTTSTCDQKQMTQVTSSSRAAKTRTADDQMASTSHGSKATRKQPRKTPVSLFGYKKFTSGHDSTFQCNYCSECFQTLKVLQGHQLAKHLHYKIHSCSRCAARFQSKSSRVRHERDIHDVYRCNKCPKIFQSLYHIKKHAKDDHEHDHE